LMHWMRSSRCLSSSVTATRWRSKHRLSPGGPYSRLLQNIKQCK
jgi:hypothetical protein